MNDFPREMRQGDVVSATEYNRLVRSLRRLALIQGPGVLLSSRPNGTVVSLADTPRAAPSAITALSCWNIVPKDPETKSYGTLADLTFGNRYYKQGGIPDVAGDGALPDEGASGTPEDVVSYYADLTTDDASAPTLKKPFLALKVPTNLSVELAIAGYENYSALMAASRNLDYVLVPLYEFGVSSLPIEGGSNTYAVRIYAKTDLRNMPGAQMVEALP